MLTVGPISKLVSKLQIKLFKDMSILVFDAFYIILFGLTDSLDKLTNFKKLTMGKLENTHWLMLFVN